MAASSNSISTGIAFVSSRNQGSNGGIKVWNWMLRGLPVPSLKFVRLLTKTWITYGGLLKEGRKVEAVGLPSSTSTIIRILLLPTNLPSLRGSGKLQ
jgi:hypothetical protein